MPKIVDIEIPDEILDNYLNTDDLKRSLYEDIIIREYQKGNLSIREGAKILGLTYEEFMKWLGKHKVSWITATKEELEASYNEFEDFMNKESS